MHWLFSKNKMVFNIWIIRITAKIVFNYFYCYVFDQVADNIFSCDWILRQKALQNATYICINKIIRSRQLKIQIGKNDDQFENIGIMFRLIQHLFDDPVDELYMDSLVSLSSSSLKYCKMCIKKLYY